jgi:hypothetical protein
LWRCDDTDAIIYIRRVKGEQQQKKKERCTESIVVNDGAFNPPSLEQRRASVGEGRKESRFLQGR